MNNSPNNWFDRLSNRDKLSYKKSLSGKSTSLPKSVDIDRLVGDNSPESINVRDAIKKHEAAVAEGKKSLARLNMSGKSNDSAKNHIMDSVIRSMEKVQQAIIDHPNNMNSADNKNTLSFYKNARTNDYLRNTAYLHAIGDVNKAVESHTLNALNITNKEKGHIDDSYLNNSEQKRSGVTYTNTMGPSAEVDSKFKEYQKKFNSAKQVDDDLNDKK